MWIRLSIDIKFVDIILEEVVEDEELIEEEDVNLIIVE